MNPVGHFAMPYDDRVRIARFHEPAFGWQNQALVEDMGNCVRATTTETHDTGPVRPGASNGGCYAKHPDGPAQHLCAVIAVDGVSASVQGVQQAGGTVVGEPMEIPGVGKYVSFFDTEGNRVSMREPVPRSGPAPTAA